MATFKHAAFKQINRVTICMFDIRNYIQNEVYIVWPKLDFPHHVHGVHACTCTFNVCKASNFGIYTLLLLAILVCILMPVNKQDTPEMHYMKKHVMTMYTILMIHT